MHDTAPNFSEHRKAEVQLRRTNLPRTPVNSLGCRRCWSVHDDVGEGEEDARRRDQLLVSSEEKTPNEMVRNARRAEEAGFSTAWISDHYHPWIDAQGESPFVWSVIGGIAAEGIRLGTGATCPTIRIHPATIAQATATSAAMLEGRFWFGIGSGENLNEHILSVRWPPTDVRLEMLEEAIHVIRLLWEGTNKQHYGKHYTVENARLYTLPNESPPIHVSAFGPKAIEVAARIGDGYVGTAPEGDLLKAFIGKVLLPPLRKSEVRRRSFPHTRVNRAAGAQSSFLSLASHLLALCRPAQKAPCRNNLKGLECYIVSAGQISEQRTRRARIGAAACFLLTGVISASWASRVPAIKDGPERRTVRHRPPRLGGWRRSRPPAWRSSGASPPGPCSCPPGSRQRRNGRKKEQRKRVA
jgi:hypothetical protein